MRSSSPVTDVREEARRVLDAVAGRSLDARAIGGVAVFLCCPSAAKPPLAREYKDVDLITRHEAVADLTDCLVELGYMEDHEFNALHGHQRLFFWDPVNERQLDVFVDALRMCHTLELRDRVWAGEPAIELADLLLSKLQIVELNRRDLQDAAAIVADHPLAPGMLDPDRVAAVLAEDWGWWRTGTATLARLSEYVASTRGLVDAAEAQVRIAALLERIEGEPKSRRWRRRARLGERVRWYELPEEVSG